MSKLENAIEEIEYFEGLADRKKKAKEKVMNDILEKHQKLGQVLDASGLDANHPAMLDWASVGMGIKNLLNERDEVQALPEKWRNREKRSGGPGFSLCGYDCADELDAALAQEGK